MPEEGEVPGPTKEETDVLKKFLSEHRQLIGILNKYGKNANCVPTDVLKESTGLSDRRIAQHLRVFEGNDFAADIGDEVICSRDAIKRLRKELQGEL